MILERSNGKTRFLNNWCVIMDCGFSVCESPTSASRSNLGDDDEAKKGCHDFGIIMSSHH